MIGKQRNWWWRFTIQFGDRYGIRIDWDSRICFRRLQITWMLFRFWRISIYYQNQMRAGMIGDTPANQWPDGYFERTTGSLVDDPIERDQPRGDHSE